MKYYRPKYSHDVYVNLHTLFFRSNVFPAALGLNHGQLYILYKHSTTGVDYQPMVKTYFILTAITKI